MRPTAVAVLGPGAVGLTFAASLCPGHEVVLCGRRPRGPVEVVREGRPPTTLDLPVVTDPAQVAGRTWDWALVALKAHQVPAAAPWLDALAGPGTTVAVLQNGVEHHRGLPSGVDRAAVVPTIVWSGSELVTPDVLSVRGDLRLVVPDDPGGRSLAQLFAGTGVEVDLATDFAREAWRKLIANVVAGLEVLALRRAEMFHLDDVADLALALARECGAVARAEGVRIDAADELAVVELYRTIPPDLGTSILYDRVADRPLEWDARNGVIQRLGRHHGVATPVSDVIVPLLRAASPDSYPVGVLASTVPTPQEQP